MTRVLVIVGKLFENIFYGNRNMLQKLLVHITKLPFLYVGVCFLIIGFSVGILKRIIHS